MIETIMKTTQKYAFLCCALFALNAQSIHAEDQSIHAEDSINHDFDDSNDRNFQECKESQREEREDQEDRPDTSRGFDLSRKLTEEQEAELNKVMNSDSSMNIPSITKTIKSKIVTKAISHGYGMLNQWRLSAERDYLVQTNNVLNYNSSEYWNEIQENNNRIVTINQSLDLIKNTPKISFFDHAKSFTLSIAVEVTDNLEHIGLKHCTNLSDDEIENKMVAERLFGLSVAGYVAWFYPPSVAVMLSGQLLYSIYKLQQRINFREKYTNNPVKAINEHKKYQKSWAKYIKDSATPIAIHETPARIVGAPTMTGMIYDACSKVYTDLTKEPE